MSASINLNLSPEATIDPFKVYIRIRPLSDKEKNQNEKANPSTGKGSMKHLQSNLKNILLVEDNLLFVLDPDSLDLNGRKEKNFVFDHVFTDKHSNTDIFENVIQGMVENVIKGFNSTALAYGVTGTGKTHTMFGNMNLLYQEYEFSDNYNFNTDYIEKGVCIYALDYLFEQITINENKSFAVKISYLEIYNEQVIDLLVTKPTSLMIVEDSVRGVVVPDLSEYTVNNSKELIKYIIEGNTRRTMAATNQNQFSSRSHAILQVIVEQRNKTRDTKEEYIVSKFLIVDLAGSERGGLEKGLRSQEGANINKSLLSLGNCINLLSDKSKKGTFVPYRDSKLTRLLKDSLGGNISTVMIACVSPSPLSYDETVNTLKYASRARTIQKKITKNVKEVDVHISQYKEIIDSLKGEIDQLKEIIKNQQNIINENMNVPMSEDMRAGNSKIEINRSNSNTRNPSPKPSHDHGLMSGSQSVPRFKIKPENINYDKDQEIDRMKNNLNNNSNNNFILHHNNSVMAISNHPKNNNLLSKSTSNGNKNGNYSNISLISRTSEKHANINNKNNGARTVHNINLDIYRNFLVSANNFNIGNIIESSDNVYDKKDVNNQNDENTLGFEDLEKQIDNLQNDKILFEEYLEKSKIFDKSVSEKYQIIKSYFQKYLELINDKLIENIEQNMILKFNLKEILELNNTNNQHLSILYSQIIHFEKLKLVPQTNQDEVDGEILKLKEEMNSIQIAIQENERIKERISESLTKNLKFKKIFKKILVKLISNTSYKPQENSVKNHNNVKYEQAYKNLIKEKELLENKNLEFKQYLQQIKKEKDNKDSKLNEVQREVELLKKQLVEKDIKIKEYEKNKKINPEFNLYNTTNNEDERENLTNTLQTEMENIDINLQDEYFSGNNRKKFIKDIPEFGDHNHVNKTDDKIKNADNKITEINNAAFMSNIKSSDDSFNQIQNIRYIINQTNNIVNNNINKIINKEKTKKINRNNKSININVNISTGKELKERPTNENNYDYENKKAINERRNHSVKKMDTVSSYSNKRNNRLSTLASQNSSNLLINNEKNYKPKSKSPKNTKSNKLREFDKIIESQLNEVYNKKAKELGDKMKKKIGIKTISNNSIFKKDSRSNVMDKVNRAEFRQPVIDQNRQSNNQDQAMNRSLSISCVSINNEGDFNSELDIVEHIQQFKKGKNNNRLYPNSFPIKENENTLVFTPKADEIQNKFGVNFAEKNHKNFNSALTKQNNQTAAIVSSVSGNKNINVQKFLSSNNNQNILICNNDNKEKPVLPNKRDYSPNVVLLKQARLERQLKNQNITENKDKISSSQISTTNNPVINSSTSSQIQNMNKFISKNSVDFVNDYLNSKRIMLMTECDKIEDNDGKQNPNLINTNRTELSKSEALEQALTSLNNFNQDDSDKMSDCYTKSEGKEISNNHIPQSTDELFKCLNEVKNPKISKFLDKK